MNEKHGSNAGAWAILGAALLGAVGFGLWLIGSAALQQLALILTVALALAVVLGASALPIRAYRRRDYTGETTHHYHDGTRTVVRETRVLDGRQMTAPEVKLLQLPAQAQGAAFPELLRAGYAAGLLAGPRRAELGQQEELSEIDAGDWQGEIAPSPPQAPQRGYSARGGRV